MMLQVVKRKKIQIKPVKEVIPTKKKVKRKRKKIYLRRYINDR